MRLIDEKEKYLKVCQDLKGLSKLTMKAYRIDLEQFCTFVKEQNFLDKEVLLSYIAFLNSTYKPKSARRKTACIKAFYRYMEIEDIIEYNPFHKIILKYKTPVILPKTIPLEIIYKLLSHIYIKYGQAATETQKEIALRNAVIIELLFSTGMRISELTHLKMKDLNLTNGTIRILGKGAKERIMCIANDEIRKMLSAYLDKRQAESEYIFVNRLGNRLSEQSVRNMISNYAEEAGISMHITPHMFRHTFATELHNADVDIRYIQQLLGHSSISTTQIYTHISTSKISEILREKHPRNNHSFSDGKPLLR